MKSPSKKYSSDRIKLKIPLLLEVESEGLVAVCGSILIGIMGLAIIYFSFSA